MQPAHGKSQSASDSLGTQSEGTTFDPVPYRAAIDLVQIHGADYLLNTHELRGDEWIADIGCGEGYVLQKKILPALHTGRIIGIDISAEMLSHARSTIKDPRVNFVQARGEEIPLAPESVDLVFSNFALHWMNSSERLREALQGATEALKPGGTFLAYFSREGTFEELLKAAAAVGASPAWAHRFDNGTFRHPPLPAGDNAPRLLAETGLSVERLEFIDRWIALPSPEKLEFWFRTCIRPFMERLPTEAAQRQFSAEVIARYLNDTKIHPTGSVAIHDRAIAIKGMKPSR